MIVLISGDIIKNDILNKHTKQTLDKDNKKH
jgi:hypothetical protein